MPTHTFVAEQLLKMAESRRMDPWAPEGRPVCVMCGGDWLDDGHRAGCWVPTLYEAAALLAPQETREPRAESVPDGDRWVCDNGHASRWNIKSEHYGGNVCPVCHSWVRLYTLMYPDTGAPGEGEGE